MAQRETERKPAHLPEDKQALGSAIAKARKAAGYSLDSAAATLRGLGHEIGKAAIGHWETGTNVPDALWLQRLSRLYKVSLDELASGRESKPTLWPFSLELQEQVLNMAPEDLRFMEKAMWSHLKKDEPERLTYSETVTRDMPQPSTVHRVVASENQGAKKAA